MCLQIFCIDCHGAWPISTIDVARHHGNQSRSHDSPVGVPSRLSLAFDCLCAYLQLGNRGPKADAPEYARARYLLANLGLTVSISVPQPLFPASCIGSGSTSCLPCAHDTGCPYWHGNSDIVTWQHCDLFPEDVTSLPRGCTKVAWFVLGWLHLCKSLLHSVCPAGYIVRYGGVSRLPQQAV